MRILFLIAGFALFTHGSGLRAEERKFPYEAVVDAEQGDNVLSGPGPKYYATQKLKNGDRVMVHRHDPGGWCMIVPPSGSYSWVRASQVERDGLDKGWIKSNRVVVHTGSQFNADDFTTIQADLSKGDAVEILGEKEFSLDDGPRLMLKISPVKGEWRWIARKSIVPVDAYRSSPGRNEQSTPKKRSGPIADGDAFAQPVSTGFSSSDDRRETTNNEVSLRRPSPDQDQPSGRDRLHGIDDQFREMIKQDPQAWDLDSLESQYKQLDDEIGQKTMTNQINLRLDAVKRYRKINRDYVDFHKLTSETKQRDAELLLQQAQYQSRLSGGDQQISLPVSDIQRAPQQVAAHLPIAQTANPQSVGTTANTQSPQGNPPAFDGAGIVQKMDKTFPGGPQYVLLAPDGRMLSFLTPGPGVDLNRYNGRPMGIIGQRIHLNDWNADMITVRQLQPVQLRGSR